jgi:hypothetical protein
LKVPLLVPCFTRPPLTRAGEDPETIDPASIAPRYAAIRADGALALGGTHRIAFDYARDLRWRWDQVLPVRAPAPRAAQG